MLTRVMWAAVLSGLAAGLLLSALQAWKVLPLIERAETYEVAGGHSHGTAEAGQENGQEDGDDHDHWSPESAGERIMWTAITNLLVGVGFALLLAGVALLTGLPLTLQNGWAWGLLAFLAFSILPGFGLPPELPGMDAGDLTGRQAWWMAAAGCAIVGMVIIAVKPSAPFVVISLLIIAAPHLVGAPPSPLTDRVPPELAAAHVTASQSVMAVFWVTLGSLLGWLLNRLSANEEEN